MNTIEHYDYRNVITRHKAERELVLEILKPNKKYTLVKIQKKLRKCGFDWTTQKIAVHCHYLCNDNQLKCIHKKNKNFYFKPLDNEIKM